MGSKYEKGKMSTFPLELMAGKNVERRGLHGYDSKSDGVGRRAKPLAFQAISVVRCFLFNFEEC